MIKSRGIGLYNTILFPSDPLDKTKVDSELEKEWIFAIETGFKSLIFSYMSWFEDGIIKLNVYPDDTVNAVYRGWMMPADKYKLFY